MNDYGRRHPNIKLKNPPTRYKLLSDWPISQKKFLPGLKLKKNRKNW